MQQTRDSFNLVFVTMIIDYKHTLDNNVDNERHSADETIAPTLQMDSTTE
jgi:hypothetical protein